jgi:hypothetical protein
MLNFIGSLYGTDFDRKFSSLPFGWRYATADEGDEWALAYVMTGKNLFDARRVVIEGGSELVVPE